MTTSPPIIVLVGGTVPSDELLLWLADWLLDVVEQQEAEVDQDGL